MVAFVIYVMMTIPASVVLEQKVAMPLLEKIF